MVQKVSGVMLEDGAIAEAETGFTTGNFLRVASDGTLEERTPAQVRSDIGAGTGSGSVTSVAVANATGITWTGSPITGSGTFTPTLDATLQALAGANWAANSLAIGSGVDTVAQVTFAANTFPARSSTGNLVAKAITDYGLSLVDDADASAARTTLELPTGTYTPSVTNVTNVTSSTPKVTGYVRHGNMVIVQGQIDVTPTAAATITEIRMSLPIATDLTSSEQLSGSGHEGGTGQFVSCSIYGVAATNDAILRFRSGAAGAVHAFPFLLMYRIL